jgi:hypothetical protein
MLPGVANRRKGIGPSSAKTKRITDAAANRLEALRWLRLAILLAALLPLVFFAAAAYSD